MASKRQAEASRLNGARSRGPKSEQGKARSSRNASTHGLTGGSIEATELERVELSGLVEQLTQRYDTQDPLQVILIERVVLTSLKLGRARAIMVKTLEDLVMPHNSRAVAEADKLWGDVETARNLLADAFPGKKPPMSLVREAVLHSLPKRPRPSATQLERLFGYVRRFRAERDGALRRLEAIHKPR